MTDFGPGDAFGRYRIESEVGRGGMGIVYAARDTQIDRRVALKLIGSEIARSATFQTRFAREMRIAAQLEHPNVVPVYETGSIDGRLFIAMRFVEGADLARLIERDGQVEPRRLARVALMLGDALDAAHGKGLVHRDVKPANVLLSEQGGGDHVYLTDFGLAREAVSDSGLTNTGQWMGTADYVSPEQLESKPVSARTDIYSMACLLYHALTGHLPYEGLMVAKIRGQLLDPLPSVGPGIAHQAAIDRVLARGAQKRPEDRFLSAGDLARAVAAAAVGAVVPDAERSVATGAALAGIQDAGARAHDRATVADTVPKATVLEGHVRRPTPAVRTPAPALRRGGLIAGITVGALIAGAIAAMLVVGGSPSGAGPVAIPVSSVNATVPSTAVPPVAPITPTVTVIQNHTVTKSTLVRAAPHPAPPPPPAPIAGPSGIVAQFGAFKRSTDAQATAARLSARGIPARVLYADDYVLDPATKIPHLWLVVSNAFSDRASALALARGSGVAGSFVRRVASP